MRYLLIIFIVGGLLILGCKEKPKVTTIAEDSTLREEVELEDKNNVVVEINPCIRCDSIYSVFPKDSIEFEKLYGYPNGERQYEAPVDVDNYFQCLDKCYQFLQLLRAVKLETLIVFDADGPSYLRSNTTKFLIDHSSDAQKVLKGLSCSEFYRFIYFSFDRISRHNSFYPKLCKFLLDLQLNESCKANVLIDYCVLQNVETDEH